VVPRGVTLILALLAAPALAADGLDAAIGKALFERNWVSAPSSTKADDGLGPLYDAPSCVSCHTQRTLADVNETTIPPGTVIRLGNARGGGDRVYGRQLQTRAVGAVPPEANPDIQWMPDGKLRAAAVTLHSLGYGPLASDTKMALRRAPVLNGIALLAAIPESEILKHADPEDANHDGIKGRAAFLDIDGKRVLGRMGWKATEPDVPAQIATAFSNDIGLSTARHPEPFGDCTAAETMCRLAPHGAEPGQVEIPDTLIEAIAAYLNAPREPAAPIPVTGAALFSATGCLACHMTLTGAGGTYVGAYTDLLLHDMGEGLNDGIKEGAADTGQWRTAPLWNVAQSLKVGFLLHDGRARSVAEAIEWHGGEAAAARARFRQLDPASQRALVAFVSGL
jgi:CxxC motif-containing protein (DUF1111 family)